MAIIKAKARQDTSVARESEGNDVNLRGTRDGALFVADWKMAAIMEGRGFMVNVGAFSSPAVGGGVGGTALDTDGAELYVSIPTGTSILPLRVAVNMGLPVGAADEDEIDILLAVDQDTAHTTGTYTTETIYNMNTLHSRSSSCTAKSEATGTMTSPVLDLELAHVTKVFELFSTAGSAGSHWTQSDLLYEPAAPPIINGPATLFVFWGGTKAASAFCDCQWLEFPTSYFS